MKRLFFAIPVIAGQELLTIMDYLHFELRSEQINWVSNAEEIVLFESVLRPQGPIYKPLERFKLS